MKLLDPASKRIDLIKPVVAVGIFDGIHLGHQILLRKAIGRARLVRGSSLVMTFQPHPREVLANSAMAPYLLTTLEEKIQILESLGVNAAMVVPFTKEFSKLKYQDFIRLYLEEKIRADGMVVGHDHSFGNAREGNLETLLRMRSSLPFAIEIVEPQMYEGEVVSSSRIRKELQKGNLEKARILLGRSFSFFGKVVRGRGVGRQLGYPTANLLVESATKMIPPRGVYAVQTSLDGRPHKAMMNIGVKPTFNSGELTIEVHIFDFKGDLYGQRLHIEVDSLIREERKFHSQADLRRQLEKDHLEVQEKLVS